MSTAANVKKSDSSHWYYSSGEPCYEMAKKDGTGMRPTTLADARKLNLLPSVTTILNILHKQALVEWLCEQTTLAVLTTPRNEGEELDVFVQRVLHGERVQDEEAQKARDLGTAIHAGMEAWFKREPVDAEILPWIEPACQAIADTGEVKHSEMVLVGHGYAGRIDAAVLEPDANWVLWDFKSTSKLPTKGAWPEHVLQLAAYAHAFRRRTSAKIYTANCYISTKQQGEFAVFTHDPDWQSVYEQGFAPLLKHWCWANKYWPKQDVADQQTPAQT